MGKAGTAGVRGAMSSRCLGGTGARSWPGMGWHGMRAENEAGCGRGWAGQVLGKRRCQISAYCASGRVRPT